MYFPEHPEGAFVGFDFGYPDTLTVMDGAGRVINTVYGQKRKLDRRSVHNEPSVVNRLIRLLEEVLEAPRDADVCWYGRRLAEIKAEINGEPKPSRPH